MALQRYNSYKAGKAAPELSGTYNCPRCSLRAITVTHNINNGAAAVGVVDVRTSQKFTLGCPAPHNFGQPCDMFLNCTTGLLEIHDISIEVVFELLNTVLLCAVVFWVCVFVCVGFLVFFLRVYVCLWAIA